MTEKKTLAVTAIKDGTVIDHIAKGVATKIIRFLNLASHKKTVTVGLNLKGKDKKYKDIIKVDGRELTPEEANRVAIFSPDATINIIKNYKVKKKFKVQMPEQIKKLIVCLNPKCITNHEEMKSQFKIFHNGGGEVKLKCHYCEKVFKNDEIKEYKI